MSILKYLVSPAGVARAFLIDSREPMSATAKKGENVCFLFASETEGISLRKVLALARQKLFRYAEVEVLPTSVLYMKSSGF